MGGQNVLQFPGQNEPLPHHGISAWRYESLFENVNHQGEYINCQLVINCKKKKKKEV